ncbi:MobQ family relaxase [Chamaesiphon sp.]|uniref:MobQ family relaxase n=1 Tax=Chamaesiphon sp. TaxID=2814140 RepID=UPI0035945B94
MAIAFVRSIVAGRSGGKSAIAMAAYRAGEKIQNQITGKLHDYTKKRGVEHSEILTPIPATGRNEWLTDRAELWNRVELKEKRIDAQLTREITIAIPRELNHNDQIDLVREYVQSSFVDRGMIADINLHHLDGNNPHAHVMLTMRELRIDSEGTVSFGNKDRSWNDRKLYRSQKLAWDKLANGYLERAGSDVRIDSRSYAEQGIDKLPQIHLGVSVASMKSRDIPTDRGAEYDRIEWINHNIAAQFEEIYNLSDLEEPLTATPPTTMPKNKAQERKDADFIYVAAEYPDLKQTSEYKAAAQRSKERYARQFKTIAKRITPSTTPEPPIVKWEPTLRQQTDPELVTAILTAAERLGEDSYTANRYQVRVITENIEIDYDGSPVMVIDRSVDPPESQLLELTHTLNQYEASLGRSIDATMADLTAQYEAEQLAQQPNAIKLSPQVEIELQPELEEDLYPNIDFSDSFPDRDRQRSRQQNPGLSR